MTGRKNLLTLFYMFTREKELTIPVAYSCNDKHSMLALVSMTSIMENTENNIEFYILHSNLSQKSFDMLNSVSKYKNARVIFKQVDETLFKNFKNVSWVTTETWFRVLLPNLLSKYDKVIYLDCDTLVCGDISNFYNIDISNVLVGVVKDIWGIIQACKRTNLPDKSYFNAGVLLINSKKWREQNLYEKIMDYANRNRECTFADQDVLNAVISTDKKMLSAKYNYLEGWWGNYKNEYEGDELKDYEVARENPLIIHFTGYKPDTYLSHHSMKELWWKYARKTVYYNIEQEKKALKEIYYRPQLNYTGAIPICYILDENNAIYTITSILSILENTKNVIDFTIIDLGLSEETKNMFTSLQYDNFNIKFVKIISDKIPNNFPILDYLVFKIYDFIPNFDKVIYLKNTTLVNGDIQEFYNYDISKVLLAAVQDIWNKASSDKIQLGNNNYFSCGVMLLNVENIKKANLIDRAIEYKQNNPNLSEQDILNKIINEDKILLSPRYNYMETWWTDYHHEYKYNFSREYEKAKTNPLIIHFTGYLPDNVQSRHSFSKLWWQYLKKTDFYIQKMEEFRLNFYSEKVKLGNEVAKYKNKLKDINSILN